MKQAYIGGIQRFSTEDGPGIRTTIFFKGCPLSCKWCHNPELLDPEYGVLYREKDCIKCRRCVVACTRGAISLIPDDKKIVKRSDMDERDVNDNDQVTEKGDEPSINIDRAKCDGCGACVVACPSLAMFTKSKEYTIEELLETIERDKDYYEMSGGGVTLSGGEVLMHAGHAHELGRAVKDAGYTLAIETSGFGQYEDLEALAQIADHVLFDVKHTDAAKHQEYIGADNVMIRDNLARLAADVALRDKIIIRLPLVHGVNDDEENITKVAELMKELGLTRVDLLPYHNMGVGKAKEAGFPQETFETPPDELLEAHRETFKATGLKPIVMGHEE